VIAYNVLRDATAGYIPLSDPALTGFVLQAGATRLRACWRTTLANRISCCLNHNHITGADAAHAACHADIAWHSRRPARATGYYDVPACLFVMPHLPRLFSCCGSHRTLPIRTVFFSPHPRQHSDISLTLHSQLVGSTKCDSYSRLLFLFERVSCRRRRMDIFYLPCLACVAWTDI